MTATPLKNNNLLQTEREGRTEEYWPQVVAVPPEPTYKNDRDQCSSVRLELARLVSSLLYGTQAMNLPAFENKNTQLMTISMETIRIAKFRPRKNQSEGSHLPQDYLTL